MCMTGEIYWKEYSKLIFEVRSVRSMKLGLVSWVDFVPLKFILLHELNALKYKYHYKPKELEFQFLKIPVFPIITCQFLFVGLPLTSSSFSVSKS